ncbi:MAG: protein kinase [Deltaproteobacteria bacterium]|nr:protein kinase [Deltaproteobacteria bacterium]MBW2530284.1 protein kinase [Deltaproteobacteria bacterium]
MFCPRCHRELPERFRFCPYDGVETQPGRDLERVGAKPTHLTDELLGRRYRVRGFIGKGSIARVYLAEDEKTGRPVAVKVLEEPHRRDETVRTRFLREARAVTKIGHPGNVEVLEAGIRDDDGAPYLVMEFLFGEPVGRYLAREGTCPAEIALPALRQAASALAAAHHKGIVHRDIKPDNLFFIGGPGDPYELKVLDFGCSKLQQSNLTAAGVLLGTPGYMAPEQVVAESVGPRTDVYALGMVMYRMATGRLPFPSSEDVVVLAHQLHVAPPPPTELVPELDPRLEAVILTATRKSPAHRYPTMHVLLDDLGKIGDGRAKLWAGPAQEDRYEPETKAGKLLADALARNVRRPPRAR